MVPDLTGCDVTTRRTPPLCTMRRAGRSGGSVHAGVANHTPDGALPETHLLTAHAPQLPTAPASPDAC